jgi:hypothetical protein
MATSQKPFDMGNMGLGGLGQMLESVDMVQRAWSNLTVPSSFVPTMDVDELQKRIADLKAVEQWLNANLTMLRGTIQGLEIQRGTLVAVKAFGSSFGGQNQGADAMAAATGMATDGPFGAAGPFGAGGPFGGPFGAGDAAHAAPTAPAATAGPGAAAQRRADAAVDAMQRAASSQPGAAGGATGPAQAQASSSSPAHSPAPAADPSAGALAVPALDPTAWWDMLQRNFNQVAESALAGAGLASPPAGVGGVDGAAKATAKASSKGSRGSATGSSKSGSQRNASGTKRAGSKSPGKGAAGNGTTKPAASRGNRR